MRYLVWLITAAFGSPVVPDVYIKSNLSFDLPTSISPVKGAFEAAGSFSAKSTAFTSFPDSDLSNAYSLMPPSSEVTSPTAETYFKNYNYLP